MSPVKRKLDSFIVIRPFSAGDRFKCHDLIKDYAMSFLKEAVFTCLLKEITLQCVIISWAMLFIFFGVPLTFCLLIIPVFVILVFACVYFYCYAKVLETVKEQSNDCWVAEVYEPFFLRCNRKDIAFDVFFNHIPYSGKDVIKFQRKIIGTVSLKPHNALENAAWIFRYAMDKNYPLETVFNAIIMYMLQECKNRGFEKVELVTTEWQDEERDILLRKGFTTRQIYHKSIFGSKVSILKSQMGLDLPYLDSDLSTRQDLINPRNVTVSIEENF